MSERIDIVNQALSFLGVTPLTSIDEEGNVADQVQIQYIPARDATLEAHDWSFAIERFSPALLAEPPLYGAASAFQVPVNILRVIACDNTPVNDSEFSANDAMINSLEQIDWVMEGGNIICNQSVVWARGIRRIEDEGSFSPLFVEAFAAKLAMLLCINLTSSASIMTYVTGLYDRFIKEAKTRDGLQGRSRRIRNRSLQKSR